MLKVKKENRRFHK